MRATCPTNLILFEFIALIIFTVYCEELYFSVKFSEGTRDRF
jgi:hypothetical protein